MKGGVDLTWNVIENTPEFLYRGGLKEDERRQIEDERRTDAEDDL